jgi:NAD(P)-dependent dehydrogenase (short-subunit alcohol dehydrogenase family)
VPQTNSRVALITGANKGIGFEIAGQLGKSGYTVVLAAHNPELGRKAVVTLSQENIDARFVELDVERDRSVHAAVTTIAREFDHLDILVNNAGIADRGDGPPSTTNLEAVERKWRTNNK